jgi:hypothetical protein
MLSRKSERRVCEDLEDLPIPTPRLKTGAINHQMLAILWARRVFRPTSASFAVSPFGRCALSQLGRCHRYLFAGEFG